MNIFEQATRKKLRFDTPNGLIGVEDLWDLPLTGTANRANLDDIAKELNAELKSDARVSFVKEVSENNALLQIEFDVVIHVINVKISENAAARLAADNKAKKQKIMAIIEQKSDMRLAESSIEELEAMLNTL